MRNAKSITGTGSTDPIPIEWRVIPFLVSATMYLGSTGCIASIQYTADDVQANGYSPASGSWVNHPDATNVTGIDGINAIFTVPVTAIRVNQTAGTAKTTLVVLQGGNT